MLRFTLISLLLGIPANLVASDIHVPKDAQTIQAAIDQATSGDTVWVEAGEYREHLVMKNGVTVRSVGGDEVGEIGLRRAEMVILKGEGVRGESAGVRMAEGSTLDGITVERFGLFEQERWQHHYDTQGEELADEEGAVQSGEAQGGISADGIACVVRNNIVHGNGDVGIAVSGLTETQLPLVTGNIVFQNMGGGIGIADGSRAVVTKNTCYRNLRGGIGCRQSEPLIQDNRCYDNVRAGIGCREGSTAVIRRNTCYQNRRAGIGIRMEGTAPIVEFNVCYENAMAGIGCRDGASPTLRKNECTKNKMAGIGSEEATPTILENVCRENEMAGIGLQGCKQVVVRGNTCERNRLVALGITAESEALVVGNRFQRTGGRPPLVAVKDHSKAVLLENTLLGGGVAALLIQGEATVSRNQFVGQGDGQGQAIWLWEGSRALVESNQIAHYRSALTASKATADVLKNEIQDFHLQAIAILDSPSPSHVVGNRATSKAEKALAVKLTGAQGVVSDNLLERLPENANGQAGGSN